jgi:hypothetical protein
MATIIHRVGLGRNLTAAEVDANFDNLNEATTSVTVQDEGSTLPVGAAIINFVGGGVTAAGSGTTKTITIPAASIVVQDEGSPLTTGATTLNFVGGGISATGNGATKTITVNAGGDAQTANPLSQFAATTSAQLAGVISDETGTGVLVYSISPALTGTPTAPTAAAATNTTQIATTAHVFAERVNAATLTNKTLTAPVISTISNTGLLTLPTSADTLVGRATTDTLTNKTYDTAGGGNSFSVAGVALTANTGTGAMVRAVSPTFSGNPLVPTQTQADNSTKIASTAYVDTLGATKITITDAVSLTGANTLTQADHFNRHLSWTGGVTAAQAISSTATTGDYVELTNDGTAVVTFTGGSAVTGFKFSCEPGETFLAVRTNSLWKSLTPSKHETILIPVGDEDTPITTGTAKITFRMPWPMTVTSVRGSLGTVSSSGPTTVDINEGLSSILSTKLTIDESEKTSTTAVAAVISDSALADDAEITIDIDAAGTDAAGLKVCLSGYRA